MGTVVWVDSRRSQCPIPFLTAKADTVAFSFSGHR